MKFFPFLAIFGLISSTLSVLPNPKKAENPPLPKLESSSGGFISETRKLAQDLLSNIRNAINEQNREVLTSFFLSTFVFTDCRVTFDRANYVAFLLSDAKNVTTIEVVLSDLTQTGYQFKSREGDDFHRVVYQTLKSRGPHPYLIADARLDASSCY